METIRTLLPGRKVVKVFLLIATLVFVSINLESSSSQIKQQQHQQKQRPLVFDDEFDSNSRYDDHNVEVKRRSNIIDIDIDIDTDTDTSTNSDRKDNDNTRLITRAWSFAWPSSAATQTSSNQTSDPASASIFPCYDPGTLQQKEQKTQLGMLFLKPMKVGGSTAAGVQLQISKHVAERQKRKHDFCQSSQDHKSGIDFRNRKKGGVGNGVGSIIGGGGRVEEDHKMLPSGVQFV